MKMCGKNCTRINGGILCESRCGQCMHARSMCLETVCSKYCHTLDYCRSSHFQQLRIGLPILAIRDCDVICRHSKLSHVLHSSKAPRVNPLWSVCDGHTQESGPKGMETTCIVALRTTENLPSIPSPHI